ncbi:MAG: hypothetical protein ABI183_20275 [Polyangiaceae bacterium]
MIKPRALDPWSGCLLFSTTLAISAAAGCSSTPPATSAPRPAKVASHAPAFDPCKDSGPVPRKYFGLLKNAKCEQEMYLTMAKIAGDLGVECGYCHVQNKQDAKQFDFPAMTTQKQQALFMGHDFMDGLKRKDGEEMRCKSCHVDKNGNPSAKFLGMPRDIGWTTEWMNLVMTNRFVHTDGTKVKCKDCHAGNVGSDKFQKTVIMQGDQVTLPGVTPFQRYQYNGLPPGETPSSAPPPASSSSVVAPSTSASTPPPATAHTPRKPALPLH